MGPTGVEVARVYDPDAGDGARVLVDRLWPRGVRKDEADLAHWAKEVAPSDDLRRWYGHEPDRFEAFADRYRDQLVDDDHAGALDDLVRRAAAGSLVLLTATKDVEHSHAVVLATVIRERLRDVRGA